VAAVISLDTQTFLGHNQETYQDLHLALQLNLRRQLLLAVCDDVALQTQLARQLEVDLNPFVGRSGTATTGQSERSPIVTLRLDTEKPDLVRQVLLWLKQHRLLKASAQTIPAFQILGLEQLTRRSPTIQNTFLASLIHVDALITRLDCRLLIWVPRPWMGKVQQAVPSFWRSRSGLFEFAGDPTPSDSATIQSALKFEPRPTPSTPPPVTPSSDPAAQGRRQTQSAPPAQAQQTGPTSPHPAGPGATPIYNGSQNLWTMLREDLSAFEQEPQSPPAPASEPAAASAQTHSPAPPASPSHPLPSPATTRAAPLPSAPVGLPTELAQDEALIQLWQYAQTLEAQQAGPLTLAHIYLGLGQMSRDRIEAGTPTRTLLDFAINAYRRAVPGLVQGDGNWCDTLNDLASLYWLRSQQDEPTEAVIDWLKLSVSAYHQALQGPPPNAETLLRLSSNLGTVYSLLASLTEPLTNLQQSCRAFGQALQYAPVETLPREYANLQNSLGAVYWRLAQLDQPQHYLRQAITAYTEALRDRNPQGAPLDYAMIQNNLGIAYWSLAQHEQPRQRLEQAIAAYHAALEFRTLAQSPSGCAATNNNLGTAYWDLAQQHRSPSAQRLTALQQAVTAYENALNAAETALQSAPASTLGFDLWATFHSAGVVHDQLAQALSDDQHNQRQQHLAQALRHYLMAYQGWQDNPPQLEVLVAALVYNIHLSFEILGLPGQQAVLSQVPGELLPQILAQL
jgi:tetratricopeptide (TPR) repeat protein